MAQTQPVCFYRYHLEFDDATVLYQTGGFSDLRYVNL